MNYLLFAGSLRKDSLNKKLLKVAEFALQAKLEITPTVIDLKSLSIPVYDGDVETAGFPEGVINLGAAIKNAQAIVICSPEYNGSMSGVLKNTIDWVSRLRPIPWEGKPVLLMGASPGALGATRGLAHARAPFETLGAYLFPSSLGLPRAHEAFDPEGKLMDEKTQKRLEQLLVNFDKFAKRF